MTLMSGTKLAPYEIESAIGAGGVGELYRARDTRPGRTVAIEIATNFNTGPATSLIDRCLGVRALYQMASECAPVLGDSDLFLTYARYLFFNDDRLATLLLAEPASLRQWASAISTHLNMRIACFSRQELDSKAVTFDRLVHSGKYDPVEVATTIFINSKDVSQRQNAVDSFIRELPLQMLHRTSYVLCTMLEQSGLMSRNECGLKIFA